MSMEEFSMKTVKFLFKEGVGKHEIFGRAVEAGLDRIEVSRYLAGQPDRHLAERYNKISKILIWILSVLVFLGLAVLSFNPTLSRVTLITELIFWIPIIGYSIYLVYKKEAYIYDNLSAIFLMVMLKSSVYLTEYFTGLGVVVVMGIEFTFIMYMLALRKKLFPYQNLVGRRKFGRRKTDDGIYIYTQASTGARAKTQ